MNTEALSGNVSVKATLKILSSNLKLPLSYLKRHHKAIRDRDEKKHTCRDHYRGIFSGFTFPPRFGGELTESGCSALPRAACSQLLPAARHSRPGLRLPPGEAEPSPAIPARYQLPATRTAPEQQRLRSTRGHGAGSGHLGRGDAALAPPAPPSCQGAPGPAQRPLPAAPRARPQPGGSRGGSGSPALLWRRPPGTHPRPAPGSSWLRPGSGRAPHGPSRRRHRHRPPGPAPPPNNAAPYWAAPIPLATPPSVSAAPIRPSGR